MQEKHSHALDSEIVQLFISNSYQKTLQIYVALICRSSTYIDLESQLKIKHRKPLYYHHSLQYTLLHNFLSISAKCPNKYPKKKIALRGSTIWEYALCKNMCKKQSSLWYNFFTKETLFCRGDLKWCAFFIIQIVSKYLI